MPLTTSWNPECAWLPLKTDATQFDHLAQRGRILLHRAQCRRFSYLSKCGHSLATSQGHTITIKCQPCASERPQTVGSALCAGHREASGVCHVHRRNRPCAESCTTLHSRQCVEGNCSKVEALQPQAETARLQGCMPCMPWPLQLLLLLFRAAALPGCLRWSCFPGARLNNLHTASCVQFTMAAAACGMPGSSGQLCRGVCTPASLQAK